MYIQGRNPGLGEIDWNSIVKDVVGGYAAVKSVQTQANLTKLQIQQAQQQQAAQTQAQAQAQKLLSYQLNPQYSGTYGAEPAPASNMMPLLLIGGGTILLLMLMKG